MTKAVMLVVLVLGCGSVTAKAVDGADGSPAATGGAGGELGGRGGQLGTGGAGGELGGRGAAGAAACPINNNAPGFAFNSTCDGGAPSSNGCHASCELAGAHYVGCVDRSDAGPLDFYCYPSCAACP